MDTQHTPILFPYDPEELWDKLREIIRSELDRNTIPAEQTKVSYEVTGMTKKPIYKAAEVCKMLSISRQTLHQWMKDSIIRGYKIKSRLFFLASDIEKLVGSCDT